MPGKLQETYSCYAFISVEFKWWVTEIQGQSGQYGIAVKSMGGEIWCKCHWENDPPGCGGVMPLSLHQSTGTWTDCANLGACGESESVYGGKREGCTGYKYIPPGGLEFCGPFAGPPPTVDTWLSVKVLQCLRYAWKWRGSNNHKLQEFCSTPGSSITVGDDLDLFKGTQYDLQRFELGELMEEYNEDYDDFPANDGDSL